MYSYTNGLDSTKQDTPCYKSETEINEEQENIFGDDKTFDKFIENHKNFHISQFTLNSDNHYSVEDCEKEAKKHYSNFFLVNNLQYNTSDDNFNYTCTIPKNDIIYRPIQKETTDRSNIFTYLISPVNDFITNVFSNQISRTVTKDTKTQLKNYLQRDERISDNQCTIYAPSDPSIETNNDLNAFGSKNRYVIYKTKLIDTKDNHLQIKRRLTEYNDFNNKLNESTTGTIDNTFSNFLRTVHQIKEEIVSIRASNLDLIDQQEPIQKELDKITVATEAMWGKIFDDTNKDSLVGYYRSIQDDTDLLNIANKNYLNFIDALENEIKKEKKIFNKLKLTKNGNNAKLHDTNLLKQIKLIEIIFLIILPIIVLFFVIKKK